MLTLVVASMGCGGRQPYDQIPGSPVATATQVDATLSGKNLRLVLAAQCQRQIMDVWCPPRRQASKHCDTPPTIRKEEVACPRDLDFKSVRVSIRSPWGRVYSVMSSANGVASIPVDWTSTGIDPLMANAAEKLATGWLVYGDKAPAIPLSIQPADVERMQIEIGAATDTQYDIGAANEKAVLFADFTGGASLVLGRQGMISLAITNRGPQPAYRVVAKLRSSVDALHGHQISFGRIEPGKTKIKTHPITLPVKLDDHFAIVVAEISYFNGERFENKKRFDLVPEVKRVDPPRGLAMDCKLATPEVGPGERVRLDCELRNLGKEPANELGIAVSIRGVASKNLAPKSLQGAGSAKLDLIGFTSASEQPGAEVPVVVRATAPGLPAVEQTLSVRIASFSTKCKARLTRDEYKAKRKRLQAALDSGALTQKEFENYDTELVSCLQ